MNIAINRSYNRPHDGLRPLSLEPNFYDYAEGSVLIQIGNTHVICVATLEDNVPHHMRGKGSGWLTGEYNMLPRSSSERIKRERDKVGGRTQEIQRLIGRSLRSVIDLKVLGEKTLILDCDVIRADGGTRCASITGAFVAAVMAIRKFAQKNPNKVSQNTPFPVKDYLSAISVGVVKGTPVLDLDYIEDSSADTDMNLIMTGAGKIVEIQGTAEKEAFSKQDLDKLIELGALGCTNLCKIQREILGPLDWTGGKPV